MLNFKTKNVGGDFFFLGGGGRGCHPPNTPLWPGMAVLEKTGEKKHSFLLLLIAEGLKVGVFLV
jgi:hypothetical protein